MKFSLRPYLLVVTATPNVFNLIPNRNMRINVSYGENSTIKSIYFFDKNTNNLIDTIAVGKKFGNLCVKGIFYSPFMEEEGGVRYTPNFNVLIKST